MKRAAAALWSRVVRARSAWCQCGCGRRSTEAAHVLGKGPFPSVRFLLLNGLALAHECHVRLGSAQIVGPSPMRDLLIHVRGRMAWNAILTASAKPGPAIVDALETLKAEAKAPGLL